MTNALRGRIEQVDGGFKAPDNIVLNKESAQAIYERLRLAHISRITLYAGIEGLIAGNPPYDPTELARHGLSHIANFNNLDGLSLYKRASLAYWSLLHNAATIATFSIKGTQQAEATHWASIMGIEFTKTLKDWKSFSVQMGTLTSQLVKFGISPVIWPDERDWKWDVVEIQRFFVPDQAQSDINKLTHVAVETVFTFQYLWEVYLHAKDNPKSPWKAEELGRLLVSRANSFVDNKARDITDAMELQHRLTNKDISFDIFLSDSIRVVSLFYKEYSGEISHYMFDRDRGNAADFIFFADEQYDNFREALQIFTMTPGEFTIHSNKGVGHTIYSGAQATMMLDCDIVNMSRLSSTPFIKSPATGLQDFEQVRVFPGVPTNIGNAEFIQNTFGANINQLIGAAQYMYGKINFNAANSGEDPGVPDRNQGSISKPEAQNKTAKEFAVLKNNIQHFYLQYDCLVENMAIKMLHSKKGFPGFEAAEDWKRRCIERGVPEQIFDKGNDSKKLPDRIGVKATRVAGEGSVVGMLVAMQTYAELTGGNFGPREAKEYKRMAIIASFGVDFIDTFMQDSDDVDERAGGASLAGLENIAMKQGESPTFSADNEHRSHMANHLALANFVIKSVNQRELNPIQADKIFTVMIPHLSQHMEVLSQDIFAQQFVEGIKEPLGQINRFATLNRKNAARMIQAEIKRREEEKQKTDETLTDIQRKDITAKADIDRKNVESVEKMERAREQSDNKAEIMREKVQADAANKRLEIQLENQGGGTLEEKSEQELRADLSAINGSTPAPYDIEEPVSGTETS